MNHELQAYKQKRIDEANQAFHAKVAHLNSVLATNTRNVVRSRARNKTALMHALIQQYQRDIGFLRNYLHTCIQRIQSFTPEFNVSPSTIRHKKALLIGINYLHTPYELKGCIDDTNKMQSLLTNHGFNEIQILTDVTPIKPTKVNILNEMKQFIASATSGDLLFLYYSGHGSYTYDRNGDETDHRDEMLVSLDALPILDDELKTILQTHLTNNVTIVGLFDSCHSGTIFDLKFNYLDSNHYDEYFENDKVSECQGNVIMCSGCMDIQTSVEALIDNKAQGALTWSFIETLTKTPTISWRELLKSMRNLLKSNGFSQIPQLSTDSFYDIDSNVFI